MTHASLFYFVFLATILVFLFLIVKKKETKRFGTIALALILATEIFFFNFHSFHLLFGGYEKKELDLGKADITYNATYQADGKIYAGSSAVLEFKELDMQLGSVFIDCDLPDNDKNDYVNVSIDAKDETYASSYRYAVATGKIVNGDEHSSTIVLDLSGNVSDLKISFAAEPEASYTINSITVNSPVPFHLSSLRLLILSSIVFILYALFKLPSLIGSVSENSKVFSQSVLAITAVFVIAAIAMTFAANYSAFGEYHSSFKQTSGNQITQEIVDAFEAGQVSLLETPNEQLLNLNNPYDWSERTASGAWHLWDHLLFEGKYYSYYGIAPVLLLYMPYHMATGYYFPAAESILIFGAVGIIFLSLLFLELIKRFFPRLPVNIALLSLFIIQMSSGIWYCFVYPNFYEIAQSCGFMFTCAGIYFLLNSGVVGKGAIKKRSLILSSFCLSMAVLSRPTLALYCIVALIFLGFGFIKMKNTSLNEGKSLVKESAKFITAALLCYVVIGGIQVVYNYMRFGNIFDFGIQYSLTINDFTRAQYHTDFAAIGFWNFLFAFPIIKTEFPFVFSNFSDLSVNGYYFIANTNAVGLIWRALPTFGYLGAVSAYKKLDKKHRLPALLLIGSCCVVAPLIIIFSIWESGYGVRYCADFAWQLIVGALCIIFFHYVSMEKDPLKADTRKLISKFFAVAAVVSLFINFAMIYDYIPKTGMLQSEYMAFENIFNFWK